ncbi:class I fructose-bisphosphate aldolase [Saccharopolyspora phatthalungensis]|uniref:Class I fructose-bisphosphate aldolase n=1 Tax=Saccharopolyspora phatthalungensis TaxID=664693 RepID=A0A840QG51_9PSEU|nr:hypothetical protein [Saccharopolyspora phatthalungensis]MBB5159824.1 class I fructose-bisphosphate aldolase [Saccharopolyspora phatthalungensis]
MSGSVGKQIRLGRILRPDTARTVCIGFDLALVDGPAGGGVDLRSVMSELIAGAPDGILVSPGAARLLSDCYIGRDAPALLVRLDWTNEFRAELNHEQASSCLIAQVEDAVALGADAVVTFLFLGYADSAAEADDIARNAAVSRACERLGVPHIVQAMAKGRRAKDRRLDPALVQLAARIAAEIGADLVKADYTGADSFATVAAGCPVPILVAGGPARDFDGTVQMAADAVAAGASGVVIGRNVLRAPQPARLIQAIRSVVHDGLPADQATPLTAPAQRSLADKGTPLTASAKR